MGISKILLLVEEINELLRPIPNDLHLSLRLLFFDDLGGMQSWLAHYLPHLLQGATTLENVIRGLRSGDDSNTQTVLDPPATWLNKQNLKIFTDSAHYANEALQMTADDWEPMQLFLRMLPHLPAHLDELEFQEKVGCRAKLISSLDRFQPYICTTLVPDPVAACFAGIDF
ncbi:Nitrogen permease regulator-like 3 [Cichlidogyrus casuarinus]|uniref:Nitrogen permease regulator-like 3 n=1 Tax=Cichlidogyrus casuarinus TaxID=1844966 RepID=A0ABD2Q1T9_9PLAT